MLYLSIVLSVIPVLFYLIILWWFDKYEREPIKLVLIHFFWGMVGAVTLSMIFSFIVNKFIASQINQPDSAEFIATIITAPFVEEAFKGFFLLLTFRKINFDNLTDGIVYGGSIGLGFGMTENFLYFFFQTNNVNDLIQLAIVRNLFSISTHFLASATFGAIVAISKYKNFGSRILTIIIGYLVSVGIHTIWNFTVSFNLTFLIGIIFIIISLFVMFLIFRFSLSVEKDILLYEMNDEIQKGYLKYKYASVIPDYRLRNKSGWIYEQFRKEYIKLATSLAFKKYELKNIKENKLKEIYENEIESLRTKLNQLELESEGLLYAE